MAVTEKSVEMTSSMIRRCRAKRSAARGASHIAFAVARHLYDGRIAGEHRPAPGTVMEAGSRRSAIPAAPGVWLGSPYMASHASQRLHHGVAAAQAVASSLTWSRLTSTCEKCDADTVTYNAALDTVTNDAEESPLKEAEAGCKEEVEPWATGPGGRTPPRERSVLVDGACVSPVGMVVSTAPPPDGFTPWASGSGGGLEEPPPLQRFTGPG